jgi:hypothetical protein
MDKGQASCMHVQSFILHSIQRRITPSSQSALCKAEVSSSGRASAECWGSPHIDHVVTVSTPQSRPIFARAFFIFFYLSIPFLY